MCDSESDVNVIVAGMNKAVQTAADETLPLLDTRTHAKYISEKTVGLIEERAQLRNQTPISEWGRKRARYLTREVRRRLKAEREAFILMKCEECEQAHYARNPRALFQVMNQLAGRLKSTPAGAVTSEQWVGHFRRLFTSLSVEVEDDLFEKVSAVADAELAERLRRQIPDGPPSMVELRSVLKGLKKGKASKDNLVMELYQEAGDECLTLLHRVCV